MDLRVGCFSPMDFYPDGERRLEDVYRHAVEQAQAADRLGFDSMWVAENHFTNVNGVCPSPAVLLSHMLGCTDRIALGSGVCVLPLHNPLVVAEDYAVLDLVSAGRLRMGVGTGFLEECFRGFGVPMEERRERFREALEVLTKAWSGQRFSHSGRYYAVDDVQLNVRPRTAGDGGLWVSVSSRESIEAMSAAGHSLLLSPFISGMGLDELRDVLRAVREDSVRRHPPDRQPRVAAVLHFLIDENGAHAVKTGRRAMETRMRGLVAGGAFGGRTRVAERILSIAERKDLFAFGDPGFARERVAQLRENGVEDLLLFLDFGGLPQEAVLRSMRLFAERVLPYA